MTAKPQQSIDLAQFDGMFEKYESGSILLAECKRQRGDLKALDAGILRQREQIQALREQEKALRDKLALYENVPPMQHK